MFKIILKTSVFVGLFLFAISSHYYSNYQNDTSQENVDHKTHKSIDFVPCGAFE